MSQDNILVKVLHDRVVAAEARVKELEGEKAQLIQALKVVGVSVTRVTPWCVDCQPLPLFIDVAEGAHLDLVGEAFFRTKRASGETDVEYRKRFQTAEASETTRGSRERVTGEAMAGDEPADEDDAP